MVPRKRITNNLQKERNKAIKLKCHAEEGTIKYNRIGREQYQARKHKRQNHEPRQWNEQFSHKPEV